jgi:hypothetical protein
MVGLIWPVRADAEFVQAILGGKAGRRQTLAVHGVLSVAVDRSRLVVTDVVGCRLANTVRNLMDRQCRGLAGSCAVVDGPLVLL